MESKSSIEGLKTKHGPGAVSNLTRRGDKYTFPGYSSTLDEAFPASFYTSLNEAVGSDVELTEFKDAARLICVPKTWKAPRLIAAEPVVHQFLQQGLMQFLRQGMPRLLRKVIDFNDQEPSRALALKASKDLDLATVDLSAASDRLSVWTVESFFRGNRSLLEALLLTRSEQVYDPIWSGETREIRKFAPMGSAVTFPVQSIVYATAAFSAVAVANGWDKLPTRSLLRKLRLVTDSIQVFGDDLIVPVTCLPYLDLIFGFLQLKINSKKTHYRGYFRESCGMDAYNGRQVTPVYISHVVPTHPDKSLVAYVEQSNNAHRAGLWCLASAMLDQLPLKLRRLLPVSSEELGCVALFTFLPGTAHHQVRWGKKLHRHEVYGLVPSGMEVRERRNTWADLLQFFTEGPEPESEVDLARRVLRPGRQNVIGTVQSVRIKLRSGWVDARTSEVLQREL